MNRNIEEMYKYAKGSMDWESFEIFDLVRLYNEIAEEFDLDLTFWVDGCEYWWDDEIYCYVHIDNIGSVVFDRWVKRYTDWKQYKDLIDYLLVLQGDAENIKAKILHYNQ